MPGELKLLPCPFCGSAAVAYEVFSNMGRTHSYGWNVQCKNVDGCGVDMSCEKKARNGAIEHWNRRAKAAETVATGAQQPQPKTVRPCKHVGVFHSNKCTPTGCKYYEASA